MLLVPSHFTPYVVSLQPNRSGRKIFFARPRCSHGLRPWSSRTFAQSPHSCNHTAHRAENALAGWECREPAHPEFHPVLPAGRPAPPGWRSGAERLGRRLCTRHTRARPDAAAAPGQGSARCAWPAPKLVKGGGVLIGHLAAISLDGDFHLIILLFRFGEMRNLNRRGGPRRRGQLGQPSEKAKNARTAQGHSGAGVGDMGKQETTIFANPGRGCRCED